jgi:hypothetical protein
MIRTISIVLSATLTFAGVVFSETINVPADYPTIQQGIDAAVNGDTVLVAPGTYVENIDYLGKSLTITSSAGPEVTVIDGNQAGSVVTLFTVPDQEAILDGFTITNGNNPDYFGGGGICFLHLDPYEESYVTVSNNIITENYAFYSGGGIYQGSASGLLFIKNNIISNNTTESTSHLQGGGGIYCTTGEESASYIDGNLIIDNTSPIGGGIYCPAGYIGNNTVTGNSLHGIAAGNCVVDGNIVNNNTGHGICVSTGYFGGATVKNNLIHGNNASPGNGGGLHIDGGGGGGWEAHNNIIWDNIAEEGGGIYSSSAYEVLTAIMTNNIVYNNQAVRGGGVCCNEVYVGGPSTLLVNNTIVGNVASEGGGGIYCNASAIMRNTILWNDDAPIGPEVWVTNDSSSIERVLDIGYCNLKGGLAGVETGPVCALVWGDGMISSDPLFVDAENGDYHITFTSPCRGSGDNTALELGFHDFETDPRIFQGTIDIGADEFYTHLYYTGDATPGGSIEGKLIGLPGTWPVGLFFGSGVLENPVYHMWGDYWLQAPWILFPLVPIPSNGILVLPTTLPGSIPAPYDVPMQALIGLNADSLTNLCVLEVR